MYEYITFLLIKHNLQILALSIQSGYSRAHGVNLLASGYNDPKNKNGGSGIYLANGKTAEAYISGNDGTKLIIQDVPIIQRRTPPNDCSKASVSFKLLSN